MVTAYDPVTNTVLTSATINVYSPGTVTPISATIFDRLGNTLSNPLTSDATTGLVDFYLNVAQEVDLVVSKGGFTTRTYSNVPILDDSSLELTALLTTTGDIVYASSANTPVRLPIGSTGQLMTPVGGVPAWSSTISGNLILSDTNYWQFGTTNPAGAGDVRLRNNRSANWRNAGNTNDNSVAFNASDQFVIAVPIGTAVATIGATFLAMGSSTAAGGYIRLPNAQATAWRNSTNSADDSIQFDGSDNFLIRPNGNTMMTVTSSGGWLMSQGFATSVGVQLNTGSFLYSGSGVPANGSGSNGDFYFRVDGGAGTCLYQRRAGSWVATGA